MKVKKKNNLALAPLPFSPTNIDRNQVVVLVVTLAMFGTAIYGCTKLETNYNPVLYMNQNSYQVSFYHTQANLFPNDGERIDIFVGKSFL